MTLRTWFQAVVIALCALVAAGTIALVVTAVHLRSVSNDLLANLGRIETSLDLTRSLSAHRRHALMLRVGGRPSGSDSIRSDETEVRRSLEHLEAQEPIGITHEEMVPLHDAVDRYFGASRGAPRDDTVVQRTYHDAREAATEVLAAQFRSITGLATLTRGTEVGLAIVAGAGFLLAAIGCVFIVLSLRRRLMRPVAVLLGTIEQIGEGGTVMVPAKELHGGFFDLARALSNMAQMIHEERATRMTAIAGVAHDLRTPVTAMKLLCGVIESGLARRDEERVRRSMDVLQRQVDYIGHQVDDLLEASRGETGGVRLTTIQVDLMQTIRDVAALFGDDSHHPIRLDGPDELRCEVDPVRIHQVFVNLVSNAVKYSPAGGAVRVSVAQTPEAIDIAVSDIGIGIAPEDLPHLFKPFRRGRAAGTKIAGAGLGLSVSRKIVEAHHGGITVDSVFGHGSTFHVRLPRARPSIVGGHTNVPATGRSATAC